MVGAQNVVKNDAAARVGNALLFSGFKIWTDLSAKKKTEKTKKPLTKCHLSKACLSRPENGANVAKAKITRRMASPKSSVRNLACEKMTAKAIVNKHNAIIGGVYLSVSIAAQNCPPWPSERKWWYQYSLFVNP